MTLLPTTLADFIADPVNDGIESGRAVTLDLGTLLEARSALLMDRDAAP